VVAQEETIGEEITNPQAIRKNKSKVLIKQIIMTIIITKAILSHLHKSCSKRVLNPSFLLEKHQYPGSLQFFILILTKAMPLIIREGALHREKVLVDQLATKRFSKEKIVALKMRDHLVLSIRKSIIMVINLKVVHGRIKKRRIRVSH
jgi:hypothetical protein